MSRKNYARLLCSAAVIALASGTAAFADDANFNIAPQSLDTALNAFSEQSAHPVLFKSDMALQKRTQGVTGSTDPELALNQLLQGTGLTWKRAGDTFVITEASDPQSGSAAGDGADQGTVQALIVTAQKREENIQDVPIAMSAFTQEDLTRSQVAGGPDLMTQVPNMTFTKTNFSSYSIQIRGIGTQAISATTDAAVAVAFNNTPFIRNRFFEQEFYDLQRVEVLRGPQGTLYGRNATAGVVNIISQKPNLGRFEAKLSGDVANYNSTRLEGMINIPLAGDAVALRLAGAWTKRDGYSTNEITGNPIDGRDLWSTRVSLRVAPTDAIDANLVWEHFQENDDRLRSGKQLCHQDDREKVGGLTVSWSGYSNIYSQGCLPASLYGPESFEAPNGQAIPYYGPVRILGVPARLGLDPYVSLVQSRDLRVIESTVDPKYTSKSDLVELQMSFDVSENLKLTSETGYNYDNIFSKQDFNRFNTAHGVFETPEEYYSFPGYRRAGLVVPGEFGGGVFCDPQIGCADRLVAIDVSRARSRQFSQEFRLSSDYDGAFNFSLGANFLRYDTEDKYYVFINTLTMFAAKGPVLGGDVLPPWEPGVSDNMECMPNNGLPEPDWSQPQFLSGCIYVDPNPIESVNDQGHNYFLSKNPYKLISYAAFGEAYYQVAENLKVTAGLRWTVDKKEAPRIPSWLFSSNNIGYPVVEVEEQEWREPTGRLTVDWKPDPSFTDETLLYASYAHGYKAGGSNPPRAGVVGWGFEVVSGFDSEIRGLIDQSITKPKTFDAEFVNAFELGAKNTLFDGAMTLNLAAFYYDYTGYQVSQIIDRSAVNYNFDAKVWGLEIEADWRPVENLRLGLKGGYENTRIADGEHAVDIMDRTAGHTDWVVLRPFPSFTSNCIVPAYTIASPSGTTQVGPGAFVDGRMGPCEFAYVLGHDPVTNRPYVANPTLAFDGLTTVPLNRPYYIGYDPNVDVGQNNGEGFFKDLSGNELPNAPHFTATVTADYTIPLPNEWLATLHTDLYYQSEAWTRVFNMPGYDKLKAFTNVNVAAIFSNEDAGWKVMAYVKNVFDKDNITGAFLNSDDSGLTTNVFLVEPRLFGLRVTKEWNGEARWANVDPNRTGPYPLTVELGGSLQRHDAPYQAMRWSTETDGGIGIAHVQNPDFDLGYGGEAKVTWRPQSGPWSVAAGFRYGRTKTHSGLSQREKIFDGCTLPAVYASYCIAYPSQFDKTAYEWARGDVSNVEKHDLIDFEVGRDFGLGGDVMARVSAGLRYADFNSQTHVKAKGVPEWVVGSDGAFVPWPRTYFETDRLAERSFTGAGPALTLDLSKGLMEVGEAGRLKLDAQLSAGLLFGKQKTSITGREAAFYDDTPLLYAPSFPSGPPELTPDFARENDVAAPVASASLGLSYAIGRAEVGAGYRWERYFDVLDGGVDEAKDVDRTFDGPYFKIAVGFGG